MTSVLTTGDLTVNGSILLYNECPVIQSNINTTEAVLSFGTTSFPFDDSIPQNTEATEVITCSITPQRSDSTLNIEFFGPMTCTSTSVSLVACLFRDSTANALKTVCYPGNTIATYPTSVFLTHQTPASSTSTTTFKIRAGKRAGDAGSTGSNAALFGGTLTTYLRVTEIMNASTNYIEP